MIHRRHVELHAVKLQKIRHELARFLELYVSVGEIELRVVRPAVVGRHHPAQTVLKSLLRIHWRRVDGITPLEGFRGILAAVVAGTPVAVNVGVTRQPPALLRILGRQPGGNREPQQARNIATRGWVDITLIQSQCNGSGLLPYDLRSVQIAILLPARADNRERGGHRVAAVGRDGSVLDRPNRRRS